MWWKVKSQSAITWYQWVCLCWHHTCAHIHFPQGSVRVSALSSPPCSPSSPVSASQSPGPSPRAATVSPRRLSPHHAPLTSPQLTLAREPWAHHQASPASQTKPAKLSPYLLNPPKAPSPERGELQLLCDVTLHCARYEYCSYWSYRHQAGASRHPQHCCCHNRRRGAQSNFWHVHLFHPFCSQNSRSQSTCW